MPLSLSLTLSETAMDPWSDETMSVWVPIAAYWVYSIIFHFLMKAEIPFFEKYRIHTSDDMKKRNRVSAAKVLTMVTIQQSIQAILGLILIKPTDPAAAALKDKEVVARWSAYIYNVALHFTSSTQVGVVSEMVAKAAYWIGIPFLQFFCAMVIMDTHQYFLHRLFHLNKFLYKHIHSHHHRLYVPYAFGALYNHPIEGFLLDTLGAAIAFELTGMSSRLGMIFFTFSNMKTVDDHCGYAFPWDPLQAFFGNNVIYHDIHHQPYGIKTNFSQPYFTFWDRLLNTMYTKTDKNVSKKD